MNKEGYAIRVLVVLLIYLSFETDHWLILQRFFVVLVCHSCLKIILRKFQFIETKEQMDNGLLRMHIHFSMQYWNMHQEWIESTFQHSYRLFYFTASGS